MDLKQWQAIVSCDPWYDGKFYYGVLSTKIFCRPSCKSKTPNIENVRIFRTIEEALNIGLRPCKRCRPMDLAWPGSGYEIVNQVKAIIDQRFAEQITLETLSDELRIDRYHLHRVFKKVTRQTPNEYLLETRMCKSKQMLETTDFSISDIASNVGFKSQQHFSAVFRKHLRCSPSEFRNIRAKKLEG